MLSLAVGVHLYEEGGNITRKWDLLCQTIKQLHAGPVLQLHSSNMCRSSQNPSSSKSRI